MDRFPMFSFLLLSLLSPRAFQSRRLAAIIANDLQLDGCRYLSHDRPTVFEFAPCLLSFSSFFFTLPLVGDEAMSARAKKNLTPPAFNGLSRSIGEQEVGCLWSSSPHLQRFSFFFRRKENVSLSIGCESRPEKPKQSWRRRFGCSRFRNRLEHALSKSISAIFFFAASPPDRKKSLSYIGTNVHSVGEIVGSKSRTSIDLISWSERETDLRW